LAATFAAEVIAAIRGASLQEILTETRSSNGIARRGPGRPRGSSTKTTNTKGTSPSSTSVRTSKGRLHRRSPEELAKALDQVVSIVKASKEGLRAEQIRKKLGMQRKELPRVIKEGLSKKQLKSKGQKRATTYLAA
jgi:hypothetical protein